MLCFKHNDLDSEWVGGVEMQLFKNIAEMLNLKWKINTMGSQVRWGELLENGTWADGILKTVADGTSDVAFCTIWLSEDKDSNLEMSVSIYILLKQYNLMWIQISD